MITPIRKEIKGSFDDAVKKVEQAVEAGGFTLLLTKSMDEIFRKKLNILSYPRYTILLACAPEFAKAALDVSKDVGLLFPCSFAVYEDQGKIYVAHISIMKSAAELGLAPIALMQPVIEKTGAAVQKIWALL